MKPTRHRARPTGNGAITRYTPLDQLPEYLSIEEFCMITQVGRSLAYDLCRRNLLAHRRFGSIVRILKRAVQERAGEG